MRQQFQGMLLGATVVLLLAFALYLLHPVLIARRRRLRVPDPEDAAALVAELERLRRLAGVSRPVAFRLEPFAWKPSAFVFGLPGRRRLVVSGGLAARLATDPAAFRAVVLHELAHLRNRDVDLTYGALAFTGAFALLDGAMALAGCVYSVLGPSSYLPFFFELALKTVGLLVVVLALTAAIVRSRELNADARVGDWGAEGAALDRVLAALPTPDRRRIRLHPTPATRLAALRTGVPAFGTGLGSGMAIAVACGIGGYGLDQMTAYGSLLALVPWWGGAVTGALLAVSIVTSWWRTAGGTGRAASDPSLWRFGTGMATGLALGMVLLPAFPDTPTIRPGALALWVVVWVPLVTLVAGPLTFWLVRATRAMSAAVERAGWRGWRESAVLAAVLLPAGAAFAEVAAVQHSTALTTFPFPAASAMGLPKITDPAVFSDALVHSWVVQVLFSCTAFTICLAVTAYALHRSRHGRSPGAAWKADLWKGLRAGIIGAEAVVVLAVVASLVAHRAPVSDRWDAAAYHHFLHLLVACSDALVALTALLAAGQARGALVRGGTAALTAAAGATLALALQPSAGGCVPALGVAAVSPGCLSIPWRTVTFMSDYVGAGSLLLCAVLLPHSITFWRWLARTDPAERPTATTAQPRRGSYPWRMAAVGLAALGAAGFVRLGQPNLRLINDDARVEALAEFTFVMPPGWFVADTGEGPSDPELWDLPQGSVAALELQALPAPAYAPEIAEIEVSNSFESVTVDVAAPVEGNRPVSIQRLVVGGHRAVLVDYGARTDTAKVYIDADPGTVVFLLQAEPGSPGWAGDEADLQRLLATVEFRL
ncbi:M48 family metalloprotease [Kitasatospora viridis]|uniref:Peptidase M48-like protein n=1 Tax=Kitasatospora viridis TaxID=281105 RepID=A0A561TSP1_9ACTN|nr:M48 family metalloprotease [Kitasatospora viridis]TWF90121.1 peptidase M48-like protein [Kitasatospora viridis]